MFSNEDMRANVFNNYFLYTDQYLTIFSQSLQTILFTGVIVITISILLLPDTVSAVSAVISIVSTLTGTEENIKSLDSKENVMITTWLRQNSNYPFINAK